MPAMKIFTLMAVPSAAVATSWSFLASKTSLLAGDGVAVSIEDMRACDSYAAKFINKPMTKSRAVESAVDHCALDKHVDDSNFVCPHYREILNSAFRREPTTKEFTAETFCNVAESYVYQMKSAARIPRMGNGDGFDFKMSEECQPAVAGSLAPKKTLPAGNAGDFWYALCINQDCAHFLPSRTRWCNMNHQPTHSSSVCEAVRHYAHAETSALFGSKELTPQQVCSIYGDFVEDTHINVKAYMHVVHGQKAHMVPPPEDKERALQSSRMKEEARSHKIRDASGEPVKSAAVKQAEQADESKDDDEAKKEDDKDDADDAKQKGGKQKEEPKKKEKEETDEEEKESEKEIKMERKTKMPEKSKQTLALITAFALGWCGVDRCYMGQRMLGIIKFLTLGGCGVWFIVDYVVIVINCLAKWSTIDTIGFRARFPEDEINTAFWIALIALILHCVMKCTGAATHGHKAVAYVKKKNDPF